MRPKPPSRVDNLSKVGIYVCYSNMLLYLLGTSNDIKVCKAKGTYTGTGIMKKGLFGKKFIPHGYGTFIRENGWKYTGTFRNGQMEGIGI